VPLKEVGELLPRPSSAAKASAAYSRRRQYAAPERGQELPEPAAGDPEKKLPERSEETRDCAAGPLAKTKAGSPATTGAAGRGPAGRPHSRSRFERLRSSSSFEETSSTPQSPQVVESLAFRQHIEGVHQECQAPRDHASKRACLTDLREHRQPRAVLALSRGVRPASGRLGGLFLPVLVHHPKAEFM
jgi:hypothetical protein